MVPVGARWVWRQDRAYRAATPAERLRGRCMLCHGRGGVVAAGNVGTARRVSWLPLCAGCLGPDLRVMDAVVVRRVLVWDD